MFDLYGDHKILTQWDKDRKIIVDIQCSEIHASNDRKTAVVLEPYDLDGTRVANVPNILLQSASPVTFWGYVADDSGSYTKTSRAYSVRAKPKPDDYVYTETEVLTWRSLDERIKALEDGGGSGGAGNDGATYTPSVAEDGTLSWTNNKGLDNPTPVNIKGPAGSDGKSAYAYAVEAGYEGTEEEFAEQMASIIQQYDEITELVVSASDYSIVGFARPAGTFGTQTGYRRTDYIEISDYEKLNICCQPNSDSVSPVVWFDSEKNYISGVTAETLEEHTIEVDVPANAYYAIFSSDSTNTNRSVYGTRLVSSTDESVTQGRCYIAPDGSDENDGLTADTPVLTLDRAKELLSEDGELIFTEGDYDNFSYDLSLFSKVSTIGNARLVYSTEKFTEATLVDGYTRVYAAPYTGSYSKYLWQFDVPDANTAISAEERHPLQRNRSYRLEHTRMYPVTNFDTTSTDLAGYLATMEATTDKWMYYMDGTNCYFTVPDVDFATHPVIIPSTKTLTASEKRTVNISGLKIYFAGILTTNLCGVLDNLTVGYTTKDGAIRWDDTFNLTLNNCEVAATMNDGINGHTTGDIACYNCWGHDCADDGESAHEECHIIQYGGLYEYNGNGCTPASGASGEYINTICRNNGAWDWVSDPAGTGFSAQNTSTTDPALMYCIGCHTSACTIGFRQKSTSKATFINCVSKNDTTAFGDGTQINCAAFDDEHPQYEVDEWTFELEDGTTVTKQVVVLA